MRLRLQQQDVDPGPMPWNPLARHAYGMELLVAADQENVGAPFERIRRQPASTRNGVKIRRVQGLAGWDIASTNGYVNWDAGYQWAAATEAVFSSHSWILFAGVIFGAASNTPELISLAKSSAQNAWNATIAVGTTDSVNFSFAIGTSSAATRTLNLSLTSFYGRPIALLGYHDGVSGVGVISGMLCDLGTGRVIAADGTGHHNAAGGTLLGTERLIFGPDIAEQGTGNRNANAMISIAAIGGRKALNFNQRAALVRDPFQLVRAPRLYVVKAPAGGGSITMPAGQGSFSLSGQNATFVRDVPVVAGQGTFSLAGQDVVFVRGVPMVAGQGSFSLSGQDAGFTLGGNLNMAADYGAISLSGQTAAFLRAVSITAAQGSFALNGQAATFVRGVSVTLDPGTFALSGQNVDLRKAGNATLAANFGSYTLTGQAAVLAKFLAWQETTPASGTWVEQSAAAGSWTPLA